MHSFLIIFTPIIKVVDPGGVEPPSATVLVWVIHKLV